MSEVNRRFLLRSRPDGRVEPSNFDLVEEPAPEPADGQALVRTLYLSLDPTNRIWMSERPGYMPPVPIGAVMRGAGLGQVVASRRDDLPEGTVVSGLTGWQDYSLAGGPDEELPFTPVPSDLPVPLSAMLGALGLTGLTAYYGVVDVAPVEAGETMVVSAAAGAVGSIAGQIGKIRGARVVGIAGTREKCDWITGELGFDAAVCHRDDDWREQLAAACPDRVDVDFENVGGDILGELLGMLNIGARIALCGMISQYNETSSPPGPRNIEQLIMRRAMIRGFLILDYADRFEEGVAQLAQWAGEGKLRWRETVVEGLEQAPTAINALFDGDNTGKLLVKVADPA